MFQTIAVGMDGSEGAENALGFAVELARRDGASLVLVHVEEVTIGKGGGPLLADEEDVIAGIRQRAEELSRDGVEARVEVTTIMVGGPAHAINEFAQKDGADLLVVGTRGQSPVAGLLLGSVTQRLLHIAEQPVLAVPAKARLKSRA